MGVYKDGLFYLLLYLPFYWLFSLLQRLYWICNGMHNIVTEIEDGQLYERSAQVFDIRYKVKKEPFQVLSRRNFIATHRMFEHPNYVLSYNISLLAVEMDQAIFVEVPVTYDIFDCRKSPFVHLGQFKEAVRIITMPISSLIRCAEELGDPKMKIIWLHSTGRCGSTAMSQVFEAIPNCTTLSEPMCLFVARNEAAARYSTKQYRKWLNSKRYNNMCQAAVRLMAKPNEHNPDILFIKNFTLSGLMEVEGIEKCFPTHINLFLYRDCLETVQSYLRSLNNHFFLNVVMKLRGSTFTRYIIRSPKLLIKSLAAPDALDLHPWMTDPDNHLSMTSFGLVVIQWCCFLSHYKYLVSRKGSLLGAIRYEDIVDQRHATLTKLFQFCEVPLEYVELAKKSLETDSQEGTVLSKSSLEKFKKVHVTDSLRDEANMYLKACSLSPLGQPTYLPNALSPNVGTDNSSESITGLHSAPLNTHISISMPA